MRTHRGGRSIQQAPKPKSIIEFGVEATEGQARSIEFFLKTRKIPYLLAPPARPPYLTLDELREDLADLRDFEAAQ
jgi:hypothetical protein